MRRFFFIIDSQDSLFVLCGPPSTTAIAHTRYIGNQTKLSSLALLLSKHRRFAGHRTKNYAAARALLARTHYGFAWWVDQRPQGIGSRQTAV